MKRISRITLVLFVSSVLIFSTVGMRLTAAAEWPEYVPTDEDIDEYEVLWQNSTSMENYFDPDADDITTYASLWYRNITDDSNTTQLTALLSLQIMDFGAQPWDKTLDGTWAALILQQVPDFDGDTVWDLMVYFLNSSTDALEDISGELGWSNAILLNFSGMYFNHLIVGTIDTKLVITYALTLQTSWFTFGEEALYENFNLIAQAFNSLITGFLAIGHLMTSTTAEELVLPTSSNDATSVEDLKTFTASVGEVVQTDAVINGFPLLILGLLSAATIARIASKKKSG